MKKIINLTVLSFGTLVLTACVNELPSCDGSDANELISQILGKEKEFVAAKDLKEIAFNEKEQVRLCQGNFVFDDGSIGADWKYKLTWKDNKKRNYIYLEFVETE